MQLSAGMDAPEPVPEEPTMENPCPPVYSVSSFSTEDILANGGRDAVSVSTRSSPRSVSMMTQEPSFLTVPDAPQAIAAR